MIEVQHNLDADGEVQVSTPKVGPPSPKVVDERAAWLAWRRGGLGASDVAGVLGISPWASPYSVWADKTDPDPPVEDDDVPEEIEAGIMLEPAIGPWFARRTGLVVAGEQTWCTHPEIGWALATVDGLVFESPASLTGDALGTVEIKVSSDPVRDWRDDGVPAYYQAQAQWQMFVTGVERTWFAVLHTDRGPRFRVYELQRDEADLDVIVERCTAFWHDHVLAEVAPAADAHRATSKALGRRRGDDELPAVDLDALDDTEQAVLDLVELGPQIDELERRRTLAENVIKAALDDHTEGFSMHARSIHWRPHGRTSLDTKAIRANHPRIAKKYSSTTTVRPFKFTPNPPPKEARHG